MEGRDSPADDKLPQHLVVRGGYDEQQTSAVRQLVMIAIALIWFTEQAFDLQPFPV